MKTELFSEVVLTRDVSEAGLRSGDVATLVDYVRHPRGGEEGAVLELFNALGESIAVVTAPASAIAPLRADHVPAVRQKISMAKLFTRPWDPAEHFQTEEELAAYLEAAFEDGNPALIAVVLKDIARAREMMRK